MGTDEPSAGAAHLEVPAGLAPDEAGPTASPADHYRVPPGASWLPLLWLALVLLLFGIGFGAMLLTA